MGHVTFQKERPTDSMPDKVPKYISQIHVVPDGTSQNLSWWGSPEESNMFVYIEICSCLCCWPAAAQEELNLRAVRRRLCDLYAAQWLASNSLLANSNKEAGNGLMWCKTTSSLG